MGIEKTIKERRSIRRYLEKKITNQEIADLLNVAVWAPTAGNKQDYYFIIVDDKVLLSRIVAAGGASFLLEADKVVFVLYSKLTENPEYADYVQSASAIIQNFLLLAHEKGIGTCWVCHLPLKARLGKLLGIPKAVEVIAAVSVGYADFSAVGPVERKKPLADILGHNRFYSRQSILGNRGRLFLRRMLTRVYYILPVSLKKILNSYIDKRLVKKFQN